MHELSMLEKIRLCKSAQLFLSQSIHFAKNNLNKSFRKKSNAPKQEKVSITRAPSGFYLNVTGLTYVMRKASAETFQNECLF